MARVGTTIQNHSTGEQITFLKTVEDGAQELQIELFMEAGREGVPPHMHTLQTETFAVLEGEFHAVVAGKKTVAKAGETVTIPPGVPHSFNTKQSGAVRLRITLNPALDTETFFETLAYASERKRMNLLQIAVLVRELNLGFQVPGPPPFAQTALFAILATVGRMLGYRSRYVN
jgi:quercetin dioxygenase-like cupin family protein